MNYVCHFHIIQRCATAHLFEKEIIQEGKNNN